MAEAAHNLPNEAVGRLREEDWEILIDKIKGKGCTPFLGPGICQDGFERRATVAQRLAARYHYPLDDTHDLPRVTRFLSVRFNPEFARSKVLEEYNRFPSPDFRRNPNDPHLILAGLPLPVYITTNHDDYMMQALKHMEDAPHRELCYWNGSIPKVDTFLSKRNDPTPSNPVVFHLYGYPQTIDGNLSMDSLVISEEDYFEFLINVSSDEDAIALRIRRAMTGTSLLLIGYRLDDWDFRVLFHLLLAKYLRISKNRTHVAVQVPIDEARPEEQRRKVQEFLNRYIPSKGFDIKVYWGTSQEFISALKTKWEAAAQHE